MAEETIEQEVKELEEKDEKNPSPSSETENNEQDQQPSVVVVETATEEPKHFDGFRGRLAEKYKDCGEDFGDDAVFEKYCNKSFDDHENELKGYHDGDEKLRELFEVWPEFKDMMQDIAINKVDPRVAIARQFSIEDLTPNSDDEEFSDWTKAYDDRRSKIAEQKAFEDELYKNMGESNGIIDAFCKDKELDEEQKKNLISKMDSILDDAFKGKVSSDFLEALCKAMNYEKAVEMAKAVGEITGRNANIEAKMEGESKKVKGDGIPTPKTSSYKPTMVRGTKAVIDFSKFK